MTLKARHAGSDFLPVGALALAALLLCAFEAAPDVLYASVAGDGRMTVTLEAGPYRLKGAPDAGRIEVEGFGCLAVPGGPQLPLRRFLVALPPGARALDAVVIGSRTAPVEGVHRIAPYACILPLPGVPHLDEIIDGLRSEYEAEYDAVYHSDEPCPARIAWLASSGGLRKYSYAGVAFCPFTYYPESGRLEYHSSVTVEIVYSMPAAGGPEEALAKTLLRDTAADDRAARTFCNYADVAGLYSPGAPAGEPLDETYDYVILTAEGLEDAIDASDFPEWKAALGHNLRTVLVTDAEIAGQPGADLAERIRNFLRAYYGVWGIEYVLIVGNYATVPMRICYPNPDFHVYDPDNVGLVAPGTPTDYYYADLSLPDAESWDLDGDGYPGEYGEDSPDFLAEVSVGRIPVDDPGRITYTLDKIVSFEQDTGAWKTNALHAAAILFFENQDYSGYPFVDGASAIDSIAVGLMSGWTVTRMSEQSGLVTSLFPWPAISESAFNSAWRNGQHAVVNWSGHGWSDGAYRTLWEWDDGDGVPESGNGEMRSYRFIHVATSNLDDDHPSVVFAISCNVGYPEPNPYGNCGIDLLTQPGWGAAVAMLSSTRPASVSGDWRNSPGGTEQICYEFNRYMISEAERVGDALYDGKYYATSNYGWDHHYEYMNLYNYNLYGDPAMQAGGASAGVAGEPGEGWRAGLRMGPVEPNPFESSMTLRFTLAAAGPVRVAVHDVTGRRVALLAEGPCDAGQVAVTWDGAGGSGERLAPGVYFAVVEAAGRREAVKVVLLR
jgi:hypothetical protein